MTNINYSRVLEDIIFPSFIRSCVPDMNLEALEKETYLMRENEKSLNVSNNGGYHSPPQMEETEYENLNLLYRFTNAFARQTVDNKNLGVNLTSSHWWVNINQSHDFNTLHNHRRSDLIGLYYIKVPSDSGKLVLMRNDGSQYCNLYKNSKIDLEMDITVEVGRLYIISGHLWHYVTSNMSNQDRISVAFNLYFE